MFLCFWFIGGVGFFLGGVFDAVLPIPLILCWYLSFNIKCWDLNNIKDDEIGEIFNKISIHSDSMEVCVILLKALTYRDLTTSRWLESKQIFFSHPNLPYIFSYFFKLSEEVIKNVFVSCITHHIRDDVIRTCRVGC